MFGGQVMFDGNMQVKLYGVGWKTLRTDYGCIDLQKADPNKEMLVMVNCGLPYNEIHTGYIVRMKSYDKCERPCFGLKHEPDSDMWTVINYCDVVAWGYADGGLNDPTLFYSCHSTVAEEIEREKWRAEHGMKTHAEKRAEMANELDDELEEKDEGGIERKCVKLRIREDGDIQVDAVFARDEEVLDPDTNHAKGLFHDCAKAFDEFRKQHPEVTEIHFYTDEYVRKE